MTSQYQPINDDASSELLASSGSPNQYGAIQQDDEIVMKPKNWIFNKRYISIIIMLFTMLCSSISFSIIFGSVWPYFQQIDHKATADFLGYIIAACSFGQMISSPIFGIWSNHRPVVEPVIVSLIICMIGGILYTYAEAVHDGKWVLLFSRLIIGIGTGNIAVARSYVSAATNEKERSTAMSALSSVQGLGFILGPALGLVFQPLGNTGVMWKAIDLRFNLYTGPGFLIALLCIFNGVLLVVLFREFNVHGTKKKIPLKQLFYLCVKKEENCGSKLHRLGQDESINDMTVSIKEPATKGLVKYDRIAAWSCIFLFFLILTVFAVLETLLAPIGEDMYAWTNKEAAFNVNLISTINSIIAIAAFVGTRVLLKWIPAKLVLLCGMVIMIMGFLIWLPFRGHPPIGGSVSNSTDWFGDIGHSNTTILPGCNPSKQPWCHHEHKVYFFQYVIGLPVITIGYCSSSLLCYTIFSMILGPWPQGLMMGFISVSGSAGRSIGPLVLARLYHEEGPLATFLLCIGIVAVGIVTILVTFVRLVPYSVYSKKQNEKKYVLLNTEDEQAPT
ncbi:major facilitator superfamily domain-containing protein 8-like isoform X2 [Dysidea avara]